MTDKNGVNVDVGSRVWFTPAGGEDMGRVRGTLRSVRMVGETYEAWVDDGDPAVSDPRRNRLTTRRRVHSEDIEVVRA
jgi:hypothetical protein